VDKNKSESEAVKDYFKQLTGNTKLPTKIKVFDKTGKLKGYRYTAETSKGKFTLRDFSHSKAKGKSNEKWTIDVPKSLVPKGTREIKFK